MSNELVPWFLEAIVKLSNSNCNKKDELIEIKSRLNNTNIENLQQLLQIFDLKCLFHDLELETGAEEAELLSDVLYALLIVYSPLEALKLYGLSIQKGLAHSVPQVKRSFLKILLNYAKMDVPFFPAFFELFPQVLECLLCSDRGIAEGSVQFFKQVGCSEQGAQVLLSEEFLLILKKIMQENDITRFRIYEIVVEVAVKSKDSLEAFHRCDILPSLLAELKSTDALIQLNALELLTNLTASADGLLYLQLQGVIQYLTDQIINLKNEPLSFILLPGIIEFFGNLYQHQPSVFSQQHPEVLQLMLSSFNTVDPALLGVLIATVGKIGSSDEGKRVLETHEEGITLFFRKLGGIISRKDTMSVTAMNTLSFLMQTNDDCLKLTTKRWFEALGPDALQLIVGAAKLPFAEVRLSALQLLGTIAFQSWGTEVIVHSPGLIEFLLDRDVEFDKDCKIAKYDVVRALVANPTILEDVISQDTRMNMRQHVTEGPFYVSRELETALEQA